MTTTLVALLVLATAVGVAIAWRRTPAFAALGASGVVLPVALAWALAPRCFEASASGLRVVRPLATVTITRAEIRGARVLNAEEARRLGLLGGALRTLGTSGLFGYYGRFRSPALGAFRMYATRGSGFVLVDTLRGPVVVTPDDPAKLVSALGP